MRIEQIVLTNLLFDEVYARTTLPFLKKEYLSENTEKLIFQEIDDFVEKYNGLPTKETLLIELNKSTGVDEKTFENVIDYIEDITYEKKDTNWLIDNTEQFCQDKAIYNAIMASIAIIDDRGGNKSESKGSIPTLLSDALSVSFDSSIGHDFI